MKIIRIATRGSRLALAQTEIIRQRLKSLVPEIEVSTVIVRTSGDRDRSEFLHKTESIGFFTSELEKAVLDSRADVAVHSLKDLPTEISEGLEVSAICERHYPADALVCSKPASSIQELPSGSSVGTSSLRRIAQVKHIRDDLTCVPLRGNVETRIRKVFSGQADSIIVASAGLYRLGLGDKISAILEPEEFLPAPGQGAIAVQQRGGDSELSRILSMLDEDAARIATQAERTVLRRMQGGCSIPLGAYARISGETILIEAAITDIEGERLVKRSISAPVKESVSCAKKLGDKILDAGGRDILEQLRGGRGRDGK